MTTLKRIRKGLKSFFHTNISTLAKRLCAVAVVTVVTIGIIGSDYSMSIPADASSISSIQTEINSLKQKQKELQSQIDATRNDAAKEKENQAAIDAQIQTTNDTIAKLDEYITLLNDSIVDLESKISQKEDEIAQKRIEIYEGIDTFKKRIRAMYVAGNTSMASILLDSADFYDMLMRIELISRVAEHDDELINGLLDLKASYEADVVSLENDKNELEVEKANYQAQCDDWLANLNELTNLMQQSQSNLWSLQQHEASIQSNLAQLEALEAEREKELEAAIAAAANANRVYVGGTFTWPVPGFYTITSGVGYRWGSYHKGIDISSGGIAGQAIVASNAGTVIKVANSCPHNYGKSSNCCGNGYGRYAMIDHGGGYVTLYAHATNIIVYEGQTVSKGETIGYVGTTGYSTGNHLHFEIRLNSKIENPMDYFSKV